MVALQKHLPHLGADAEVGFLFVMAVGQAGSDLCVSLLPMRTRAMETPREKEAFASGDFWIG